MKKRHSARQWTTSAYLLPDGEWGSENSRCKNCHRQPCGGTEVQEEAIPATLVFLVDTSWGVCSKVSSSVSPAILPIWSWMKPCSKKALVFMVCSELVACDHWAAPLTSPSPISTTAYFSHFVWHSTCLIFVYGNCFSKASGLFEALL